MSIHTYCALFPPNKYFTCFTAFHLCGNSFLQSLRAKTLVTGLVLGSAAAETQPQSLARNSSSAPGHCRPRPSATVTTIIMRKQNISLPSNSPPTPSPCQSLICFLSLSFCLPRISNKYNDPACSLVFFFFF